MRSNENVHQERLAAAGAVLNVADGVEILIRRESRKNTNERENDSHTHY
jgi:hypothetical protein